MNELLNIDNFSLSFCSDQKFSNGHRIAIALAIILQPKLLILGEPAPTRLWDISVEYLLQAGFSIKSLLIPPLQMTAAAAKKRSQTITICSK